METCDLPRPASPATGSACRSRCDPATATPPVPVSHPPRIARSARVFGFRLTPHCHFFPRDARQGSCDIRARPRSSPEHPSRLTHFTSSIIAACHAARGGRPVRTHARTRMRWRSRPLQSVRVRRASTRHHSRECDSSNSVGRAWSVHQSRSAEADTGAIHAAPPIRRELSAAIPVRPCSRQCIRFHATGSISPTISRSTQSRSSFGSIASSSQHRSP